MGRRNEPRPIGDLLSLVLAQYGITLPKENDNMLVLSRKLGEKIVIGDQIKVVIVDVRGDKVRLGIEAPADVPVHRQEVYDAIKRAAAPAMEQAASP